MYDGYEKTVEFALCAGIAEAISDELGSDGDVQPAFQDPSAAGQVNRAYRIMVNRILRSIAPRHEDLPALLSWVLVRIARRRLAGGGLPEHRIDALLAIEPPGRDDWVTFLILATWPRIEQLLEDEGIPG
jgi:hypothetical protein